MSIELTEQQREALTHESESPPRVIDRKSNLTYVLIPAEAYQRMRAVLDEDDVRYMEPHLAELSPEDWEIKR